MFFSGIKKPEVAKQVILYINDPLCSWCYGFSPEAEKIKEKYKEVAELHLVEGGLRPDGDKLMDNSMKNFLRTHWHEVNRRTGQPFSYTVLDTPFIYNTEPPCRAVVTLRKLKPEASFEFLKAIQSSFYVKGKNPGKVETYLEILPEGVNQQSFKELFQSKEMKVETQKDFKLSDSLGIQGFPAVMVKKGSRYKLITEGYVRFDKIEKQLDKELLK